MYNRCSKHISHGSLVSLKSSPGQLQRLMGTRNASSARCPPTQTVEEEPTLDFSKEVKIVAVPYRWTPPECLQRPLDPPIRMDDHFRLKNHQRPYKLNFYDPERQARLFPKFEHIPCVPDVGPRRPRKPPSSKTVCIKEAQCVLGGQRDQCRKLTCPGCAPARDPSMDVEESPDWCYRVEPPTPSFHECLRALIPDLPPSECRCLTERGPPCDPAMLRRPAQANR